jgi:ketosteroid isomerase-like protein
MKRFLQLALIALLISSCSSGDEEETGSGPDKFQLIEADRAFSAMCKEKGLKAAFLEYIDSNGVLLRPGEMPFVGAAAIDFLVRQDDSGYELQWEPGGAEISSSGDMGYTYGVYEMKIQGEDSAVNGTYVTIWKKQGDGKWKFSLDAGSEGIPNR